MTWRLRSIAFLAAVFLAQLFAAAGVLTLGVEPAAAQWFWGDRNPFQSDEPPPRPRRAVPQQQQQGFGFNFPFFGGGGGASPSGPSFWEPDPQGRRRPVREPRRTPPPDAARTATAPDAGKAPPPRKQDADAAQTVLVLGDSMADWLAYGLEDTFAEGGEFAVVRKARLPSGLIRSEPRDYDWVAGAREIAGEKGDFVVVMMGLGDRKPIRERAAARSASGTAAPGTAGAGGAAGSVAAPKDSGENAEGDPPAADAGSTTAEADRAGQTVSHEFRSEKWAEIYGKRVDEMMAALKAKRVPVIWVGLPPIRGPRTRAELSFLNDLFRDRAQKAGIVYVDVWESFVDENGDFALYGPDVIGQVRRLRAADGVHFTKAGARKLAHYVDREIQRLLSRETPVALPVPDEPQKGAGPASGPAARPQSGPVVPLVGAAPAAEPLVAGRGPEPPRPDPTVAKVLAEGQPLDPPRGRADDFSWSEARAAVDTQAIDPPLAESIAAPARPARARAQIGPGRAASPPAAPARGGPASAPASGGRSGGASGGAPSPSAQAAPAPARAAR